MSRGKSFPSLLRPNPPIGQEIFVEADMKYSCVTSILATRARNLVVFCLLLFVGSLAFAQEATILGTVTDPSGSVLPNVNVTITNTDTGQSRAVTTSSDGHYQAPSLTIGHYTVKAEASGFESTVKNDVVLYVGALQRVDFAMKVGSISEKVTVEANPISVQSDTSEISNVITGDQVTQLATNGRSLYTLFALTPGASSVQGDFITPTAVSGDSNVSINGSRAGHNLQLIDGGENLDRGGSSASVMPSLDAIAEFRNMTSNYSAEYGLSSAATITQVVKSGTKQYHFSAWEFLRNDALDSRNFFNPSPQPVSELRFNTFGFNVGGPVAFKKTDNPKTFFFYNMEWRKLVQGQLLNLTVPLPSSYGGNLGSTAINVPTAAQLSTTQQLRFLADGLTPGAPFPNNTIPTNLLDPNAQSLLKAGIFPAPTNGAQFQGGNNSPTNVREEIVRVDHNFNDRVSMFGHFIADQISQTFGTTQWSADNVPTVSDVFNNPGYSAVVHLTDIISPTLLNEVAFNYNGNRIHITPEGLFSAPTDFTFNRLFSGPNTSNRIPSIALGGSTGTNYTSNWTPWDNAANSYQIRDDISWTKGPHQLKMGGSWATYRKNQQAFANTQGNFTFNGSFTGNDFADFLLGYAQLYTEDAVKITGQWNNNSYAAYIQDNWRVTQRLTLNLGLRWDGIPHTYEANNQSSNFYPNLYNPANAATFDSTGTTICSSAAIAGCTGPSPGLGASPNPILQGVPIYLNGVRIGGVGNTPNGLVNNYWANFGPRVGFAYDLTGAGKTILRGGFGTMYERIQGNDMYNGATNPPGNVQPRLNNVSLSNPGLNVTTGQVISAALAPVLPASIVGINGNNYKAPLSYQYSLGIQQALGAQSVLGVSYVGNQQRHQNDYQQINLPPQSLLPALLAPGAPSVNTFYNFPGYTGLKLAQNEANGSYNSLQVDLRSNIKHELQIQFGYTYSRAIDSTTSNGSGADLNNVTNPYIGWRYDHGPSVFDRTHVAFVNFVYDIPFLKNSNNHLLKTFVGGWELSGIITIQSGAPLNMGLNGTNVSSIIPNSSNRPDLVGRIRYPQQVNEWFDTSAFAAPALGTYGTLGHDEIRGPGRDNWNMSLFKAFTISESRGSRFELRADAFNTWNHTQFKGDYNNGGISTNFGASNFGAVTAAFDPREFQLGAKLVF